MGLANASGTVTAQLDRLAPAPWAESRPICVPSAAWASVRPGCPSDRGDPHNKHLSGFPGLHQCLQALAARRASSWSARSPTMRQWGTPDLDTEETRLRVVDIDTDPDGSVGCDIKAGWALRPAGPRSRGVEVPLGEVFVDAEMGAEIALGRRADVRPPASAKARKDRRLDPGQSPAGPGRAMTAVATGGLPGAAGWWSRSAPWPRVLRATTIPGRHLLASFAGEGEFEHTVALAVGRFGHRLGNTAWPVQCAPAGSGSAPVHVDIACGQTHAAAIRSARSPCLEQLRCRQACAIPRPSCTASWSPQCRPRW